MIISLDTETTGVDLAHGAMPFLVTTCDHKGVIRFWEWDVDPLTRQPHIPQADIADIIELIDSARLIYLHNSKFDARALAAIGIELPWPKVRDTLIASHLLASNHRHDLTSCCIEYLGVDIEKYELKVKEVTQACRAIVKRDHRNWMIADEGKPGMPSVTAGSKRDDDKPWKNDMWLPRALYKVMGEDAVTNRDYDGPPPEWLTVCSDYANADSEHTLPLGLAMERMIRESHLWQIYEHRLRMPEVDCAMESYGVTARGDYTTASITEYERHVADAEAALTEIAAEYGHELELAKGATINDNMRDFFYGATHQICPRCGYVKRVKHWNGEKATDDQICRKCSGRKRDPAIVGLVTVQRDNLYLPVINGKKTGNATLDSDAMKEYLATVDGAAYEFIELLADKRMYDTALSYMHGYRRYWIPSGFPGYYRIHCSINPCGTDHLRQASNSPNMQNVSGDSKELSNRACFGPLPNREWWRMDFKSIENRIPPYECGEERAIEVFEKPNEPPYWGSMYYLTASVLYPDVYWPTSDYPPDDDRGFKKAQPKLYKRSKFFNLARQYGCGPRKGDLLSGIRGSFDMVAAEFPKLAALQAKYLRDAERYGYVETLPDRTVDPDRGYPILASRTEDGRVLSTTPFNYHVSGTACWVKNIALVLCHDKCAEWRTEGFDAHIALEIHDEILFDFPRGESMEENLPLALELRNIMESIGGNLVPPIPTPVSLEYHTESWERGVAVK